MKPELGTMADLTADITPEKHAHIDEYPDNRTECNSGEHDTQRVEAAPGGDPQNHPADQQQHSDQKMHGVETFRPGDPVPGRETRRVIGGQNESEAEQ